MSTPSEATVLVAIVNYRTPDLTIDCLRSLIPEKQLVPGMQVIVTDNNSGDDSAERIAKFVADERLGDWITFRLLPLNGGFAYGNNEAIRGYLSSSNPPDYFLLLNPDTVIRPRAVRCLLDFMQTRRDVGIAGSRMEDPDSTPQRSAFRFPTMASEFDATLRLGVVSRLLHRYVVAPPTSETEMASDWVSGASMLIRRQVFDAIGLLDDGYFMYFEEVDFCWRARKAGWTIWYVPSSRVVHLVGQASGITNQRSKQKRRPDYWFNSRRRFFLRNRGFLYAMGCDAAALSGLAFWQIRRLLERKPPMDPPQFLWDLLRHSVFLKGCST